MKTPRTSLAMTRFGARLCAVVALCLLLFLYAAALWPHTSVSAQTKGEPVSTQVVMSTVSEKDVPARKEGADVKEATDADGAQVGVDAPLPEAITATTYVFSNTSGVALEDMSSGTTQLVGANLDDTASGLTNLGFDFWYDGVRATQFSVNANGICRLGGTVISTSFNNTNDFASTTNAPKIAPYFDDLWTGTNGKVHFKVTGSAPNRKLIVEWQNEQIPRVGAGTAGAGTFQMWLFETTGVIQFVYGSGIAVNSANGGYSIGLQSGAATNFASVTTTGNTVSYVTANNTQTNAIASGTSYIFTPQTATAPSGVNFTGTTPTGTTVNWTDNSSNEFGFAVYRSLDNVNFTFITQTAANATSFADSGLTPNTQYFYQVRAVTEGAVSAAASSSTTTAPAGNISSTATGGNWSDVATWVGGVVPTAGDNVTIADGATVTIDTAAVAFSVTVGTGGTPAILQYEAVTVRTLTVGTNVTVATNGTLQSAATGTVTTHTLSLGGNLTNNGVLDFSTNTNTAAASITFTGATNNTFGGTGATTDIRAITINKGTSNANVLELNPSNFTVRGVTTDVAGFLTLTNGTFKISGTFTVTNRVFTTAIYTIPATGGIWLNNPNFVVAGTVSSTTTTNLGLFRVSQGTYNIGVGAGDEMGGGTGAVFIIEGGTVNASGRIDPQSAVSYTQTGGTVNVATVGNNRSLFGSFEIFNTGSSFTMSGGTINVINRNTGTTQVDYDVLATASVNVTGGLLVIGATGAPASTSYHVQGTTPNLTINATMTMIVTQNASAGFPLFMRGTTVTNNGTITSGTGNARFDFAGTAPMTYTGGVFGTAAVPFAGIGVSANSTSLTTLNSPIFCNRVNLFQGGFVNSNQITLGTGGTSTTVVQIGSTGLTTPGGSFDVSPVHNQGTGTGGEILLYAFETAPRTTGFEINPTRDLLSINLVDNPNGVTVAGGDLSLHATAAAIVLTNGRVITGSNTLSLSSGTATVTRTNGYVDGNFRKNFAASASKVFEVGTANGYSPATVNVTAGAPGNVTVRANQGKQPNIPGTDALQRYWTLTAPAGFTADLTYTYLQTDVVGTETNYLVYKYDGAFTNPAGSSVNTVANTFTAPAQTAFTADWTAADPAALVVVPGMLQFSAPTYSVAENVAGGMATITVTRTGGNGGAASIQYSTADGTAHGAAACGANVDYVATAGTLMWADGDAAPKTFNVPICNETVFENNETVNLALTNAMGASAGTPTNAVLTITNDDAAPTPAAAGSVIISEFRFRGPTFSVVQGIDGARDEYVELYNNTNADINVAATDGAGWTIAALSSDGTSIIPLVTIPNGTVIPARGHYLAVNSDEGVTSPERDGANPPTGGYSLNTYAVGDSFYTQDVADNAGVAVFRTATPANLTAANRLDAVGFNGGSAPADLFREGTALTTPGANDGQYAFARKLTTGLPQDTDNNAADFVFVSTNAGTFGGVVSQRGAPGPEDCGCQQGNLFAGSPIQRNATIKASLIDPTQPSTAPPNRIRDTTSGGAGTATAFGTLDIRRKFTNTTAGMVTYLRFRVVDITTTNSPGSGLADVRLLTSPDTTANGGTITIIGTTVQAPADGTNASGAGLNASAVVAIPGGALAPSASINVRFLLGVAQGGSFRFFINVEALTNPPGAFASPTKGVHKTAGTR